MSDSTIQAIRLRLEQSERVLLTSHVRPDGDAVGSLLAFGLALQALGKEVQMVLNDGLPSVFRFLPGYKKVVKKPKGEFDLVVVLDCGDRGRAGNALPDGIQVDVNIDHHPTNTLFGVVNLIETDAVSTTQILTEHAEALGLPITQDVATALLTGILTDSQGFRTPTTTPKSLKLAAYLYELGADMPDLYYQSFVRKSYPAVRYWGSGLSNLQRDDQLIWTTLTLADRKAAGYHGRDDADLTTVLSSIYEAQVAVIFTEQSESEVKVSWRSKNGIDVSQVALQFGGGGHKPAAGATISGSMEEVQERVLTATKKILP